MQKYLHDKRVREELFFTLKWEVNMYQEILELTFEVKAFITCKFTVQKHLPYLSRQANNTSRSLAQFTFCRATRIVVLDFMMRFGREHSLFRF
jgi:hypothetical protein